MYYGLTGGYVGPAPAQSGVLQEQAISAILPIAGEQDVFWVLLYARKLQYNTFPSELFQATVLRGNIIANSGEFDIFHAI